ncbi:hypothetical protein [Sphingobacterium pedocola]|uniref:Uncharacterized protein n=1 Tax=Sphingobacterium pedocola TaxID=2082722 RepID=A0ABR9T211_9SPHI|nr:hypothetical protein [Sphingobacterium pedocola]MBE8719373.1 hypothetical protein [Sphingobacterium pedocola]
MIGGSGPPLIGNGWLLQGAIPESTTEQTVTIGAITSIHNGVQVFDYIFSGKLGLAINVDGVYFELDYRITVISFFNKFNTQAQLSSSEMSQITTYTVL